MAGKSKVTRRCAILLLAASVGILQLFAGNQSVYGITSTYNFVDLYALTLPSGANGIASTDGRPIVAINCSMVLGVAGPWSPNYHAFLWDSNGTPTDLNPPTGFSGSFPSTLADGQIVGYGYNSGTNSTEIHALLWSGPNVAIDLNPSGFNESRAYGLGSGEQVGMGIGTVTNGTTHALLWNGSNAAIDLNPASFDNSEAYATDGAHQVGIGYGASTNNLHHALLWNGSNVAVDLNPVGFTASEADAIRDGQEVGYGFAIDVPIHANHALLWDGTNTAIDLNPSSGFTSSTAYDTNGWAQVGSGLTADPRFPQTHALLWYGTNTPIDLQTLLSANFVTSTAYAIDSAGNVFGTATDNDGDIHVVEWVASVPEPTCPLVLSAIFGAATTIRRRR